MKAFQVHINAHTAIDIVAKNEDDARDKAWKWITDGIKEKKLPDWDFDVTDTEPITVDPDDNDNDDEDGI